MKPITLKPIASNIFFKLTAILLMLILITTNLYSTTYTSISAGTWTTAAIWSPAGVPANGDDVIINNSIVTINASITLRSLTINPGAQLNHSSGFITFNVGGILCYVNNGTHLGSPTAIVMRFDTGILSDVDGVGTIRGLVQILSGGPRFLNSCGLTFQQSLTTSTLASPNTCFFENNGNLTFNNVLRFSVVGMNVINNGSITQMSTAANALSIFKGTTFSNFGSFSTKGTVQLGDPATIGRFENKGGTVIIEKDLLGFNPSSVFLQESGSLVKFGGKVFPPTNNGELALVGFPNAAPNTVEYNGLIAQTIKQPSSPSVAGSIFGAYHHLIISNSNIKTLEGDISVVGNLTINDDAQLDVSITSYSIDLKGNWINNGTNTDPFIEQTGRVSFSGNTLQTITTSVLLEESFYQFQINNTAGVTLNNSINVSNLLDLTNGKINTGINEVELTTNSTGAIINHSTNSYINGNLRRNVLASLGNFDFPVGNTTAYELATLKLNSAHTLDNMLVNFSNLPIGTGFPVIGIYTHALNCGGSSPGIGVVGTEGVWTFTPTSGTAIYGLVLNGRNHSNAGGTHTILKRPNSASPWLTDGIHVSSTVGEPSVVERSGLSGFSQFAIGVSPTVVLPITLVSFTGKNINNENLLYWVTASEINNDFFTVERSLDAINFEPIGTVKGAGNSNQILNYNYIDNLSAFNFLPSSVLYYRLKQTDFDGTFTYSDVIALKSNNEKEIENLVLYPNPAKNEINLSFSGQEINELKITNLVGQIIFESKLNTQNKIDITSLKDGIYNITITTNKGVFLSKFFKQ